MDTWGQASQFKKMDIEKVPELVVLASGVLRRRVKCITIINKCAKMRFTNRAFRHGYGYSNFYMMKAQLKRQIRPNNH